MCQTNLVETKDTTHSILFSKPPLYFKASKKAAY